MGINLETNHLPYKVITTIFILIQFTLAVLGNQGDADLSQGELDMLTWGTWDPQHKSDTELLSGVLHTPSEVVRGCWDQAGQCSVLRETLGINSWGSISWYHNLCYDLF